VGILVNHQTVAVAPAQILLDIRPGQHHLALLPGFTEQRLALVNHQPQLIHHIALAHKSLGVEQHCRKAGPLHPPFTGVHQGRLGQGQDPHGFGHGQTLAAVEVGIGMHDLKLAVQRATHRLGKMGIKPPATAQPPLPLLRQGLSGQTAVAPIVPDGRIDQGRHQKGGKQKQPE